MYCIRILAYNVVLHHSTSDNLNASYLLNQTESILTALCGYTEAHGYFLLNANVNMLT